MRETSLWNKNFLLICFSSFFVFMTFYILAVTLPTFVLESLHGSQKGIGLVTTVFVIAAVIFRPLAGKWLNELDNRKIMNVSLILFAVCSALYLIVHGFAPLLVLRVIHGAAFGVAATTTSAIAIKLIPEKRKGEGIGYFTLFMSLAMVFGPFLGLTIITHFSFPVLFIMCLIFSALSLACGLLLQIPGEPEPKKSGAASSWHWSNFIETKAIPISISGFMLAFSYGAISTFISVYAKSLGMEPFASYFFIVFAALILISRPFTGRLFDRRGEHVLVYPGLLFFVVGMIWLSQADSTFAFLAAGGVIGLGYGALLPSFQAVAIKSAPIQRSGLATSTYFVFFDAGYGVGSYVLGVVAAMTSYGTMYFVGAMVVAFTTLLYYALHHRRQGKEQAGETSA
ncbi:MFS transporter [Paenibacillus sp. FSL W8-0186]|uniref:MFS transporter n=1 Tax=Paenibacillus woosongensis TaxID=307580 RepID=A0ABQ4MYR3_9BACL|nr:MFS transporter [Paenibacillus woosongensis]GIP61071.1 MFS transporter [Paenibacillus woosongensis]